MVGSVMKITMIWSVMIMMIILIFEMIRFVELLCIKSEIPLANTETAVEEVVKVALHHPHPHVHHHRAYIYLHHHPQVNLNSYHHPFPHFYSDFIDFEL